MLATLVAGDGYQKGSGCGRGSAAVFAILQYKNLSRWQMESMRRSQIDLRMRLPLWFMPGPIAIANRPNVLRPTNSDLQLK